MREKKGAPTVGDQGGLGYDQTCLTAAVPIVPHPFLTDHQISRAIQGPPRRLSPRGLHAVLGLMLVLDDREGDGRADGRPFRSHRQSGQGLLRLALPPVRPRWLDAPVPTWRLEREARI